MYWDQDTLYTYFDSDDNRVLEVDFTNQSMWDLGEFPSYFANPWVGEENNAPFNREFYLIFNVACGGTNGYFPDGVGGKPWSDTDSDAVNKFYDDKANWYSTWDGDNAAMQIDSVKVWSVTESDTTASFL